MKGLLGNLLPLDATFPVHPKEHSATLGVEHPAKSLQPFPKFSGRALEFKSGAFALACKAAEFVEYHGTCILLHTLARA